MTMTVADNTQEQARLRKPQYRRRQHLTMTVHPDTIIRMTRLTNRYRLPIGQITDKLVAALDRCFDGEGKPQSLTCINGEVCRMARRDVPEVL